MNPLAPADFRLCAKSDETKRIETLPVENATALFLPMMRHFKG
jgi:hypothetical protein